MTSKISGAWARKASWVGTRNPGCSALLLSPGQFPGPSFTLFCKARVFVEVLSSGRKAWGSGKGKACGCPSLSLENGQGLPPRNLCRLALGLSTITGTWSRRGKCPVQGETTPSRTQAPVQLGPVSAFCFLLLSYFRSFCHFFLFSGAKPRCLLPSWSLNPLLKKKGEGLAQSCSCGRLSDARQTLQPKGQGTQELRLYYVPLSSEHGWPGQSPTAPHCK